MHFLVFPRVSFCHGVVGRVDRRGYILGTLGMLQIEVVGEVCGDLRSAEQHHRNLGATR